jgi:hypothetical protein
VKAAWLLAVNLYEHWQLRRGFRVADRQQRRLVCGEDVIEALREIAR